MSKVANFTRDLWIKAQLDAPAPLRPLMYRMHEAKELARLLARPYLPVYKLRGQGKGGPLAVCYVGLEYARPVLEKLLFIEKPSEQPIGQIPFWQSNKLAKLTEGDLVIIESTKHLINKLPRQQAIVLPEFVRHVLDVRGEWEDVKKRFRKSTRYELRVTRKYGYEYEISHDEQEFDKFYHEMYVPTMNSRHGDLSSPNPYEEAYRYFKRGLLFWVKRDGQRVCGSVCYEEQGILHYLIVGVRDADEQLFKEGVIGALNTLRLQWANEQGYEGVNFLGANPYMNSGMFQYKRKWGTSIYIPDHMHRRIWLKVNQDTPAVCEFLKDTPFITVDENENLHGLIIVDDVSDATAEAQAEWQKSYETPGLTSLIVRPVSSFIDQTGNGSSPKVVIHLNGTEQGQ